MKNKKPKTLLLIGKTSRSVLIMFLLAGLFFPLVSLAYAGIYDAFNKTGEKITICYEGLVPCGAGKPYWENGTITTDGGCAGVKKEEGIVCQLCHFLVMLNEITNFLVNYIVFPVAVLLFVVGGAMFIFAAGNPGLIAQGKSVMTSVLWGLVIIFSSWIIVNTVFMFLGVKSDYTQWHTINCPIVIPE